ncbi:shikimate kinase [Ideonella sp. DXS29W]|uniref:Shikimate kinase n=1 Tax=Ideonella lacteola TaxID=2984193 RepID=A0ABU9BMA2_9BURK
MTTVSAPPPAQRIHIIGPSCAGKTTLGRALGERLGLPFTDLDDLWWSPGWVQCGHPVLRERVADLAATPAWVVSGNYFASTEVALWPRLQWLIVLDFPLGLVTRRALSRTWRRAVTGEACCNGNHEKWYRLFHRDGVIRYTWRTWATRQARYRQLSNDAALAGVTITRLGSPAEVERLWRDLSVAVLRNATPRHATPAA